MSLPLTGAGIATGGIPGLSCFARLARCLTGLAVLAGFTGLFARLATFSRFACLLTGFATFAWFACPLTGFPAFACFSCLLTRFPAFAWLACLFTGFAAFAWLAIFLRFAGGLFGEALQFVASIAERLCFVPKNSLRRTFNFAGEFRDAVGSPVRCNLAGCLFHLLKRLGDAVLVRLAQCFGKILRDERLGLLRGFGSFADAIEELFQILALLGDLRFCLGIVTQVGCLWRCRFGGRVTELALAFI